MKTRMTLLLLLIAVVTSAQETSFVLKTRPGEIFEEYYVLKDNKKIKHGQYVMYTYSHMDKNLWLINKGILYLLESGNYNHGKKQGVWTHYTDNKILTILNYEADSLDGEFLSFWSDSVESKLEPVYSKPKKSKNDTLTIEVQKDSLPVHVHGFYCMGRECSVWSYYDTMNELYFQYDYDNKILIKDRYNNLENIEIEKVSEIKNPIFIFGGHFEIQNILKSMLNSIPFAISTKGSIKLNIDKTGAIVSCEFINMPLSKYKIKKLNKTFMPVKDSFIPRKINNEFVESVVILTYDVIVDNDSIKVVNIDIKEQ